MLNQPRVLLQLEGAALLVLSLICYRAIHASWILFAVLLLAPDISIAGYLAGVKTGAALYNCVHTLVGPLALAGCGVLAARPTLLALALIWSAHIGMDRMLGFGLKYPTSFRDTHLQRV